MSGHLVIYLLFFLVLSGGLMIRHRKEIASASGEEAVASREFWMFLGMLVLLIGALQITFTTSTPVINKLFGTKLAPPVDPIDHYNRWQVPVAILVCLLIGIGQFFRYKNSDWKITLKKLLLPALLALGITLASAFFLGTYRLHYYALLFASLFAITANATYILRELKGRWSASGASIAHIGIGLILCGALISNSKRTCIFP